MTNKAPKYSFLQDFGEKLEVQERVAFSENDVKAAELKGYEAGFQAGLLEAKNSEEVHFMNSIDAKSSELISIASNNLAQIDQIINELSENTVQLACVFSKTLAKALIDKFPNDSIEQLASECFRHMRNTPHFVFRVTPEMIETLQPRLLAKAESLGFAGRIIILGDPELETGDVRIEWADGGYEQSLKSIELELNQCVQNWLGTHLHSMNKDT